MKKYKYAIWVALPVLLLAGIALWYGLHRGKVNTASSLPRELSAVARINLPQLVLDYGVDFQVVKKAFFADSKDNTGLDFMSTAYLFAAQEGYGAILPLKDDEAFSRFISSKGYTVEKQRGMQWTVIDGTLLMGFDGKRAILMGPAVGDEQENLRNVIYGLMKQKAGESGIHSSLYESLSARPEGVALATNSDVLKMLPVPFLDDILDQKDAPSQGVSLTAGLTLKKDRASLLMSLSAKDKKANAFLDKLDEVFPVANAALAEREPSKTFFHLETGLKGERLLGWLRENPQLRTKLILANTILDLDLILKSIDGDMAITVPKFRLGIPEVLVQAQLQDESFMQNVSDWNDAVSRAAGVYFYPQRNDRYMAVIAGTPVYFSTADKRLYISNTDVLASPQAHHDVHYAQQDEIRENRLYATLNVSSVSPLLAMLPYAQALSRFERIVFAMPSSREARLELIVADGMELLDGVK